MQRCRLGEWARRGVGAQQRPTCTQQSEGRDRAPDITHSWLGRAPRYIIHPPSQARGGHPLREKSSSGHLKGRVYSTAAAVPICSVLAPGEVQLTFHCVTDKSYAHALPCHPRRGRHRARLPPCQHPSCNRLRPHELASIAFGPCLYLYRYLYLCLCRDLYLFLYLYLPAYASVPTSFTTSSIIASKSTCMPLLPLASSSVASSESSMWAASLLPKMPAPLHSPSDDGSS